MTDLDMDDEGTRVAVQIHEQWPFIPVEEARDYYHSLAKEFTPTPEGAVRISLWVLKRVLDHEGVGP